jgi:hypothetical protein
MQARPTEGLPSRFRPSQQRIGDTDGSPDSRHPAALARSAVLRPAAPAADRAEVAAYADCTESQMMAMFGWTDPKMPAHYVAQANREKLSISGMEKIVAFDQSQSLDDFLRLPQANSARTPDGNGVVIPG